MARAWEAYEKEQLAAQFKKDIRRLTELMEIEARLRAEIAELPGLVRIADVFWLNGQVIESGETLEYRPTADQDWVEGTVTEYAVALVLSSGERLRFLDIEGRPAAQLRQPRK